MTLVFYNVISFQNDSISYNVILQHFLSTECLYSWKYSLKWSFIFNSSSTFLFLPAVQWLKVVLTGRQINRMAFRSSVLKSIHMFLRTRLIISAVRWLHVAKTSSLNPEPGRPGRWGSSFGFLHFVLLQNTVIINFQDFCKYPNHDSNSNIFTH